MGVSEGVSVRDENNNWPDESDVIDATYACHFDEEQKIGYYIKTKTPTALALQVGGVYFCAYA